MRAGTAPATSLSAARMQPTWPTRSPARRPLAANSQLLRQRGDCVHWLRASRGQMQAPPFLAGRRLPHPMARPPRLPARALAHGLDDRPITLPAGFGADGQPPPGEGNVDLADACREMARRYRTMGPRP